MTSASDCIAENQSDVDIVSQVKSVFASFAESLEARFSSVDQRFIQVISSSASDNHFRVDVICQDAISNCSSAAPIQWLSVLSILLIELPPCRTQTTWEPP